MIMSEASDFEYKLDDELDLETALERFHFRNACRTSNNYSCAIDCFLELVYRLLLPKIQSEINHNELSEFLDFLVTCGLMQIYTDSNVALQTNVWTLLDEIREPIWVKVIEQCPSFRNRNCDSEFYEIFSNVFFSKFHRTRKKFVSNHS